MSNLATSVPIPLDQPDTSFRVTVKDEDGDVVDISSASPIQMLFLSPSGVAGTETASLVNAGTDGKMKFNDANGDYTNEVGQWRYWGRVTFGSKGPFPSTSLKYNVVEEGDG